MYDISDLRVGTTFEYEGSPYIVLESQHTKVGRGGAMLRSKIKNLVTGVIVNKTFKGSDKFESISIERPKAQYLYSEGSAYYFMDEVTFDQFEVQESIVGEAVPYLKEGEKYQLQSHKGQIISLEIPIKMEFAVTEAEKGLKGDTASAATKQVKIETGPSVNVPLFINKGDRIIIDTRSGAYVERAKK